MGAVLCEAAPSRGAGCGADECAVEELRECVQGAPQGCNGRPESFTYVIGGAITNCIDDTARAVSWGFDQKERPADGSIVITARPFVRFRRANPT